MHIKLITLMCHFHFANSVQNRSVSLFGHYWKFIFQLCEVDISDHSIFILFTNTRSNIQWTHEAVRNRFLTRWRRASNSSLQSFGACLQRVNIDKIVTDMMMRVWTRNVSLFHDFSKDVRGANYKVNILY